MTISVRRAEARDMYSLKALLLQVLEIHHEGRPDIFKGNCRKYTDDELSEILRDDNRPVFVAVDGEGKVVGYGFCIFRQKTDSNILTDIKTLYIDDLCVDENRRGCGIGRTLLEYLKAFAKEQGCYNISLNVWSFNQSAMKFYEKMGMKTLKQEMEMLL